MENVKNMGIQNSILKEILRNKECSTGKYLAPMSFQNADGEYISYYITPVATLSGSDVLVISRLVKGNWYKAIHSISSIVENIKEHYKFSSDEYTFVLHAFFEGVELENFYLIDLRAKYSLLKLKMSELEELLT